MKVDFMKMNASKTNKKISFKACASVLVIQAAVFGFYGSAEATRGRAKPQITHEVDAAEQERQRRLAAAGQLQNELEVAFPGFLTKVSGQMPDFSLETLASRNSNAPMEADLWRVISGDNELFNIHDLTAINGAGNSIEKVIRAFLIGSDCHDLGERQLKNAAAVLQRFGAGNYTLNQLSDVRENVLSLANVPDDNLLAPYAHGVLCNLFNVEELHDLDGVVHPRLVNFQQTLLALDEMVNFPLDYDRLTPELVRGFVALRGNRRDDLEQLKQRYAFLASQNLDPNNGEILDAYEMIRDRNPEFRGITESHVFSIARNNDLLEGVLVLAGMGQEVTEENLRTLALMEEKGIDLTEDSFNLTSRAIKGLSALGLNDEIQAQRFLGLGLGRVDVSKFGVFCEMLRIGFSEETGDDLRTISAPEINALTAAVDLAQWNALLHLQRLKFADQSRQEQGVCVSEEELVRKISAINLMVRKRVPAHKMTSKAISDLMKASFLPNHEDLKDSICTIINLVTPGFYGQHQIFAGDGNLSENSLFYAHEFGVENGLLEDGADDGDNERSLQTIKDILTNIAVQRNDDEENDDDGDAAYRERRDNIYLARYNLRKAGVREALINVHLDDYVGQNNGNKPLFFHLLTLGLEPDEQHMNALRDVIDRGVALADVQVSHVTNMVDAVDDFRRAIVAHAARLDLDLAQGYVHQILGEMVQLGLNAERITAANVTFAQEHYEDVEIVLDLLHKGARLTVGNIGALKLLKEHGVEENLQTAANIDLVSQGTDEHKSQVIKMLRTGFDPNNQLFYRVYGKFFEAKVPEDRIRAYFDAAVEETRRAGFARGRFLTSVGLALLNQENNPENTALYHRMLGADLSLELRTPELFAFLRNHHDDNGAIEAALFSALKGIPLEFGINGRGTAVRALSEAGINLLTMEDDRLRASLTRYLSLRTVQDREIYAALLAVGHEGTPEEIDAAKILRQLRYNVSQEIMLHYQSAFRYFENQSRIVDVRPRMNLNAYLKMSQAGIQDPHISFIDTWSGKAADPEGCKTRAAVMHLLFLGYEQLEGPALDAIQGFFRAGLIIEEPEDVDFFHRRDPSFASLANITRRHVDSYVTLDGADKEIYGNLVSRGIPVHRAAPVVDGEVPVVDAMVIDAMAINAGRLIMRTLGTNYLTPELIEDLKGKDLNVVNSILALVELGFNHDRYLIEENITAASLLREGNVRLTRENITAVIAEGTPEEKIDVVRLSRLGLPLNDENNKAAIRFCRVEGLNLDAITAPVIVAVKAQGDDAGKRAVVKIFALNLTLSEAQKIDLAEFLPTCRSMIEANLPNDVITLANIRALHGLEDPQKANGLTLLRLNLPVQQANLTAVTRLVEGGVTLESMRAPYVTACAQAVLNDAKNTAAKNKDLGTVAEVSALAAKGVDATKENVSAYRALLDARIDGARLTAEDVTGFAAIMQPAPVPEAAAAAAAEPAQLPPAGGITQDEFIALLKLSVERNEANIGAYRDVIATGVPADRITESFMQYYLSLNEAQRAGILHSIRVKANFGANMVNRDALVNVYTRAVQQGVNPAFLNKSVLEGLSGLTPLHLESYIGYIKVIENRGKRLAEFATLAELKGLDDAGDLQRYNDFINGLDDMAAV